MKKQTEGGQRRLKKTVRTAKGRKISSTLWLQRQLNDPYVQQAKADGYRSRAAYKLLEIDDKYRVLKPGAFVIDLGAAPGGWTQVAVARTKSLAEAPLVFGIDLLEMETVPGAILAQLDFAAEDAPERLRELIASHSPVGAEGKSSRLANIVLSDIGPNTTGHTATDHIRIMALAEMAFLFAREVLKPGGAFVCKVWQGGTERELLAQIKQSFSKTAHFKPKSSRKDSAEIYLVATGFKA